MDRKIGLFEAIRTMRAMRRLKPDPVPERAHPRNPRSRCLRAERRRPTALALHRGEGSRD